MTEPSAPGLRKKHRGIARAKAPRDPAALAKGRKGRAQLVGRYRHGLSDYLEHPTAKGLRAARELGGLALRYGLGIFDLARLHEEILAWAITMDGHQFQSPRLTRAADSFLLEALSPFEAARRGLPAAYGQLEQLHATLRQRNTALAAIAERQSRTSDALRVSRRRYGKLFKQAHSLQAHIRRKSAEVILAREEERKRISRELHDEVGQALAAVNVGLVMLKKQSGHDEAFQDKVASTQALLEQTMESVHRFAQKLRPEMLELFGPIEAIRSYVRAFAARTGIVATVQAETELDGLKPEQGVALFRVAQESITNITKHAMASRVEVRFHRQARGICMEIQDNGRAFSVAEKLRPNGRPRLGLLGMQERVRLERGEFSVESARGRGTRVRVSFPLEPTPRAAVNGHRPAAPVARPRAPARQETLT